MVTRARDGVLRAFVNVCRHRAYVIAREHGCRETLQCPYHAWTYKLDGSLKKVPRSEREEGFDPENFSLLPASVDTWGPFLFVNPDPDAAPLAEALGDLPSIVAGSGLDFEQLRLPLARRVADRGELEGRARELPRVLPLPRRPPGLQQGDQRRPGLVRADRLADVLEPDRPGPGGRAERHEQRAVRSRRARSRARSTTSSGPTTTINIVPGPQNISIERWVPDGTGRTIEVTDYWFGKDVPVEIVDEVLAFDKQVGQEDIDLVVTVQAGLDSGTVPQGRLMRESEQLIADFQRRVFDAIA